MLAAQVFVWRPDKGGERHRPFFEDPLSWPKQRAPTGRRRNSPYPLRLTMDALLRGTHQYDAYMAELEAAQETLLAVPERSSKVHGLPEHASCSRHNYASVYGMLQALVQVIGGFNDHRCAGTDGPLHQQRMHESQARVRFTHVQQTGKLRPECWANHVPRWRVSEPDEDGGDEGARRG